MRRFSSGCFYAIKFFSRYSYEQEIGARTSPNDGSSLVTLADTFPIEVAVRPWRLRRNRSDDLFDQCDVAVLLRQGTSTAILTELLPSLSEYVRLGHVQFRSLRNAFDAEIDAYIGALFHRLTYTHSFKRKRRINAALKIERKAYLKGVSHVDRDTIWPKSLNFAGMEEEQFAHMGKTDVYENVLHQFAADFPYPAAPEHLSSLLEYRPRSGGRPAFTQKTPKSWRWITSNRFPQHEFEKRQRPDRLDSDCSEPPVARSMNQYADSS